jgi:DNA-binding response OmpR family regulator
VKEFVVFVLDDDKLFCQLLTALVDQGFFVNKLSDYEVTLKTYYDMDDISGAINWIEKNKPDLVLLDYMLGITSGACSISLGVLEKIISFCPNIKLLTGLNSEDVRLELVKEGLGALGIEIIQKPFGIDKLRQMFVDVIREKND